ncbi:hypothetical protein [Halorarum salinum]|uniref:Peptidase C-terminal archaeal/bacterial domain-containing protein n=1 Tax=Halorarum salinum TaxID=2743089 RepID=A0A7D5L9N1_9EURY|nr:hypothetical protein [Halobaculum salinum]QLG61354.1 hypothetical protein HUG12_06240 [Halobaculum salinum]
MDEGISIDRRRALRTGAATALALGTAGCTSLGTGQLGRSNGGDSGVDLRSISVGETKEGHVDGSDGTDPEYDDVAEPVEFEMDRAAAVSITMESDAMDAYLVLEAPSGRVVAEDDDGASGYDSRIVFPVTAGTYTVWAGSYEGDATGAYTLTVEETDDPRTGEDGTAGDGDEPDLRSISYGETKRGYVDGEDGRDPSYDDVAEPVEFDGEEGDRVAITMVSDAMDAYLVLEAPSGDVVAENDDGAAEDDSRMETTLPASGTYTIWAGTYEGDASGPYDLTLERV